MSASTSCTFFPLGTTYIFSRAFTHAHAPLKKREENGSRNGIVTGEAPVSFWPIPFPEVFAKVNF